MTDLSDWHLRTEALIALAEELASYAPQRLKNKTNELVEAVRKASVAKEPVRFKEVEHRSSVFGDVRRSTVEVGSESDPDAASTKQKKPAKHA